MFFRKEDNNKQSSTIATTTAGELLAQCRTSLPRAIEVAEQKELLKIVSENSLGISALICAYGNEPEFARALLSNSDIMYDKCKNKSAITKVLNTYEKYYVNVSEWPSPIKGYK